MKGFFVFVLLLALAAADIAAVRAGRLAPGWLALAGLLAIAATVAATVAVVEGLRRCQLCSKQLDDRRAAGDYAVKYGIRACGECGPRLEHRFGEDPDTGPPYPPNFP